jgi:uncharacterized protein DUF1206
LERRAAGNVRAMSVTATARRASRSSWLEVLTRTGFVGYGLLHLAIAWLALQIAFGHRGDRADQSGAFALMEQQPLGRFLLVVVAIGLGAMALWQLLLAIGGHREYSGRRRTMERVASAGRVLIYAFLLWTDIKVLNNPSTSSASTQQSATAGVLGHSWGVALVALAGALVFGVGAGMVVYGAKRKFESKLRLGSAGQATRQGVIRLGQFGYVARGLAFAIVGGLLFDAALTHNAHRSRGLDGALRALAGEPFGGFLLIVVAIGFAAFGIYCFFQAKYRKI